MSGAYADASAPPPAYDAATESRADPPATGNVGGEGLSTGPPQVIPTTTIGGGGDDLRTFFDRFNHYSPSFPDRMIAFGATLERLLEMDETQILNYAKVDPVLVTDLIVLIKDLQTYKNSTSTGSNPSQNGLNSMPIPARNFNNNNTNTSVENGMNLSLPLSTDADGPVHTKPQLFGNAVGSTSVTAAANDTIQYADMEVKRLNGDMNLSEITATIRIWMAAQENFKFLLTWIVCVSLTVFLLAYVMGSLVSLQCPSSCDVSTTDWSDYNTWDECHCDEYWDSQGDPCGNDSNYNNLYCEEPVPDEGFNQFLYICMIAVPVGSFVSLLLYFVCVFRLNVLKAFLYALVFVPLSLISFGFSCIFIFGFGGGLFPFLASTVMFNNEHKGEYALMENKVTHWHVIFTIIGNRDVRFAYVWAGMLFVTWFVFGFFFPDCIGYYTENCDSTDEDEVWRSLVASVFILDYLIVVMGFQRVCQMTWSKAFVLAIPMCVMMLGLSVPLTVVVLIFLGVGKVLGIC